MCDKDTCNDASCCGECEPWNCLEQQVNDILATKGDHLQGYVDEAKDAAAESKASAEASAQSAAESKEFRDEAETAASTAVAAEGVVLGVANTLQDTADTLEQIADELGTAIASIAVSTWYYTAVSENQTVIPVPADKNEVDIQSIYIEGVRQEPNRGFVFDKLARTITLAEGIPLGLEIAIVMGTYSDNPNDFANTLASNNGASLVGTTEGQTVQEYVDNLLSPGGAGLVGGMAKPVTWSGYAGGADPTGVENSDAAFTAADSSTEDVYVPPGIYNITAIHRGNYICSAEAQFIGGGSVLLKRRSPWPASGAPSTMSRLNRLAVGDTAFDNDGTRDGSAVSWLGKKDYVAPNGTLQPNLGWIEQNARGTSYASEGAIGFAGAAHSKDMSGGAVIGLAGVGVNDNETQEVSTWALYLDAKRYANTLGATWGTEIAVCNHGPYVDAYDSTSSAKTYGIALQAGADPAVNGTTADCTAAITFGNNGAKWGAGLSFGGGSLRIFTNYTVSGSYMKAFSLRGNMRVGWEGNAGETLGYMMSTNTDPTQPSGILLRANRVDVVGSDRPITRSVGHVGDKNYLQFESALTASSVVIRALSDDTSKASINIIPANGGEVQLSGHVRGFSANSTLCGTAAVPWSGGFTQSAFTVTSDETYKTEPLEITDVMLDAAAEVNWVQYQYLDRVGEKGPDGARWHFGAIAQRYLEAFKRHGLDAHRFGFLCYDEWDASEAVINEETGVVITPAVEAGSRYGIRYEEALALEAALQRRTASRLQSSLNDVMARLSALESAAQ